MLHPPLLYMGYVGFSVAFAFAIAALMSGRWTVPSPLFGLAWTLAAWVFLTLGIVLGSALLITSWARGGWWFWDPVENASSRHGWRERRRHSLSVTEQRAKLKPCTPPLSICAFSLCLLGTFPCAPACWCRCMLLLRSVARDVYSGLYGISDWRLLLLFAVRGHKVR
ncbi:cytochrome c biogenesis protein CcsA [Shigella flexneri]